MQDIPDTASPLPSTVPTSPPPPPAVDLLAVAGCVLSFLLWPAGLVLSVMAHRRISKSNGRGRDLARVGIVVGASQGALCIAAVLVFWGTLHAFLSPVDRMADSFDRHGERVERIMDSTAFEERAARSQEAFERRADRNQQRFEARSDEMHASFDKRADRMQRWFENSR